MHGIIICRNWATSTTANDHRDPDSRTSIHPSLLTSMARSTPPRNINVPSFHQTTPLSSSPLILPLLAAWCISVSVVFLALCGSSRLRGWTAKKPKRRLLNPSAGRPASGRNADVVVDGAKVDEATPGDAEEAVRVPAAASKFSSEIGTAEAVACGAATHGPIAPSFPKQLSKPRLAMSLSMKLPRKLSKIRTRRREKAKERSAEDSVWMKAIILGERCKVPVDDDEDVAFYDDEGNRRRNYRPRTPRSLPASPTTTSFMT